MDDVRCASTLLFDRLGQHLRVGKAITPPEGLFASAQSLSSPMPQATALAVANITAQLQAKDVVVTPQQPVVVREIVRVTFST
jgi:hypothetical protein